MSRKALNYCEIYEYLKDHTTEETAAKFKSTTKFITTVQRIGDAFIAKSQDGKPLSNYTPRDLMMELANRGYRGKLTFQQVIDINNF